MDSYWTNIENNYRETDFKGNFENKIKEIVSIDAWKTDNDNEEGKVIANVIATENNDIIVIYMDNIARGDAYAQKIIKEAFEYLTNKYNPESYKKTLKNIEAITKLRDISEKLNSNTIPLELKPYIEEISNVVKDLKV